MATLGATTYGWPTLLDVAKRTDPNGTIPMIAEILSEYHMIMDMIPWKEGNLPTGHQHTLRTSLPTPTFRLLNKGVVPAKSSTGQVVDTCALLEARSNIDVDVAELNGNTAQFRMSESKAFIQGMMNTWADTLITGDVSTAPETFNGLESRYFSLGSTYTTSSQLINAGGEGSDNTSIWLVGLGEDSVFGIYPKGSQAGLQVIDRGIQTVEDPNNAGYYFDAYVSVFKWKGGIAIKDYRNVVRVCNIDVSNLATASNSTDSSANILKYMSQAIDYLPPDHKGLRPVFLMTRDTLSMLRIKMQDKSNVYLGLGDLYNESIPRHMRPVTFMGIPCLRMDSITETEATITTATT
jgi:hypothetical protein